MDPYKNPSFYMTAAAVFVALCSRSSQASDDERAASALERADAFERARPAEPGDRWQDEEELARAIFAGGPIGAEAVADCAARAWKQARAFGDCEAARGRVGAAHAERAKQNDALAQKARS